MNAIAVNTLGKDFDLLEKFFGYNAENQLFENWRNGCEPRYSESPEKARSAAQLIAQETYEYWGELSETVYQIFPVANGFICIIYRVRNSLVDWVVYSNLPKKF